MVENLIFCLNTTIPVFITMIFSYFFKRIHLFGAAFLSKTNKFVSVAALPVLLFEDIGTTDLGKAWDTSSIIFCFLATLLPILFSIAVSYQLKGRSIQGEFVQTNYRNSAAIPGIAFIQNIYGDSGMAPPMIVATVPLYNITAVIMLSLMKPKRGILRKELILQTGRDILYNPIILGVGAGMLQSLLRIPQPVILQKSLHNLGTLATSLGLVTMRSPSEFHDLYVKRKPALICSFMKLILSVAIFLPIAVSLGFANDRLVTILVMLGFATTVSCYIMTRNIDHGRTLSSSVVIMTTLGSAFTLTMWLYILKSLGTLQEEMMCS